MTAEPESGGLKTRGGLGDGGYRSNLALFIDFELAERMGDFGVEGEFVSLTPPAAAPSFAVVRFEARWSHHAKQTTIVESRTCQIISTGYTKNPKLHEDVPGNPVVKQESYRRIKHKLWER